jgi:hypothetical protein
LCIFGLRWGQEAINYPDYKIKKHLCQALVAHAYNHSYWEAKIRRIMVQIQPGKTVFETLSQKCPMQKKTGGAPA